MKTKLLAVMLLAGGSMFAQTRFSVGVGFGGQRAGSYQSSPSYLNDIPPCPGPDYYWVDGYWSQDYGRNTWIAGYWNRQPFRGGYQVTTRFDNRFDDRDDRRGFTRGFEQDRNAGFHQGRNAGGQDRNSTRAFNQGQTSDSGRTQNTNPSRGNTANGFRGR